MKTGKLRKTLAIIGIALLVLLYVLAFIFALTDNPNSMRMFAISIVATVIIPVFIYVITLFLKLGKDKKDFNEDIARGEFVEEDTDNKTY